MFERLKELICDMAKFLTRLGAGLILSALPISNKESHFVRYARRFGFRADHTKREPRPEHPAHNRTCAGSSPASGIFDILTVRISGRFFFCMGLERWWR